MRISCRPPNRGTVLKTRQDWFWKSIIFPYLVMVSYCWSFHELLLLKITFKLRFIHFLQKCTSMHKINSRYESMWFSKVNYLKFILCPKEKINVMFCIYRFLSYNKFFILLEKFRQISYKFKKKIFCNYFFAVTL